MILIGSDKPGGGKDTMAMRLADYGYRRYSFGDPLKTEVTAALTDLDYRDQIWDLMPEACQQAMLDCLALGQLDAFAKPTTPEMRTLLQQYGTEFRRNCTKQTYWLDAMDQAIEVDNPSKIVIPDQRFPNEFEWGKARGAHSWYVKRKADAYVYTATAVKHSSEGQLENLAHDWRISNDGSIQDLWEKIDIQMLSFAQFGPFVPGYQVPSQLGL
jgi:hypothetical protein